MLSCANVNKNDDTRLRGSEVLRLQMLASWQVVTVAESSISMLLGEMAVTMTLRS